MGRFSPEIGRIAAEREPKPVALALTAVVDPQNKFIEFLIRDVTHGNKALPPGWDTGLSDEDKENLGLVFAVDKELWSVERIQQFLLDEFQRHPESASSGFRNAVEIALTKIATNLEIKPLEERRLLNFIANQGGNDNSLNTLRQELAERRKGDLAGTDHSEIARALIEDLSQFGEIRYHAMKFWQWKGAAWEVYPEVEILKHLMDYYGKLPAARFQSQHSQLVQACKVAASKPLCQIATSALNFANGVLTEDLELLPHNPDYGMTYYLPYRYLPEEAGKCSIFFRFLNDCWGNDADFQEKVDTLQEIMAATMFGLAPMYQRAFCLFGASKTGKTRLVEIMKGLMPPDCTSNISPVDFGDKFLPAQMFGKLLNLCGELSDHKKIDGDMFKQIIEGAELTVQNKNQQPFKMRPKAAHWFASNHLPGTRDSSEGFTRRWVFLEFKHIIPDWKKIPDFDKLILNEEREQIAAWAIEGLARLKKNKEYTLPVSHMALLDQVAEDNNVVRYFLSKGRQDGALRTGKAAHEKRSETFVTAMRLYQEFCVFSKRVVGATPVPDNIFRRRMNSELEEAFGFKKEFRDNPRHGKELVYQWITLVGAGDM